MTLQNLLPANWQFDTTQLNPIDSDGKWLLPPLVDLCARLREPGHQSHGTLKSEGAAARKNGFLHVVIPPDTNPVLENGSLLAGLRERAYQDGGIYLHILGAMTAGLEGEKPANMLGLKQVASSGSAMLAANSPMTTYYCKPWIMRRLMTSKCFFTLMNPVYPNMVSPMMAILHLITAWQGFLGLLKRWRYPSSF